MRFSSWHTPMAFIPPPANHPSSIYRVINPNITHMEVDPSLCSKGGFTPTGNNMVSGVIRAGLWSAICSHVFRQDIGRVMLLVAHGIPVSSAICSTSRLAPKLVPISFKLGLHFDCNHSQTPLLL